MADYYYGSARVRALESSLIGKDRLARLLETKDTAEIYALLEEFGIPTVTDPVTGTVRREETLLPMLQNAYLEIEELTECNEAVRIFLYPYDCNNIKAAIKCSLRDIDPGSMLFPFGAVAPESMLEMVRTEDFSSLPEHMAQAAAEAIAAYSATKNPQQIDLLLDRACYRDMLAAAKRLKNEYVEGILRAKIDLSNVVMTVRLLRMRMGEVGGALLCESLLPGGTIPETFFTGAYAEGEEFLWTRLSYGEAYPRLARAVEESDGSLTAVERLCDDAWMEAVRAAKMIPAGPEVLVAYLIACEYAVRNVRILLAGREAGLPTETIRERMRESYV